MWKGEKKGRKEVEEIYEERRKREGQEKGNREIEQKSERGGRRTIERGNTNSRKRKV